MASKPPTKSDRKVGNRLKKVAFQFGISLLMDKPWWMVSL